jgi:hypothetical protein
LGLGLTTFKLSENGLLELFYKEDGQSLYVRGLLIYVEGYGYCSKCQYFYPEENNYRCLYDRIPLRVSPRKRRKAV